MQPEYVDELLALYRRFDSLVRDQFAGNMELDRAAKVASL